MSVERIEIVSRRPFDDAAEFGDTGAYERVDAILHFAVDPAAELNAGIADLDCAGRAADGLVRFSADIIVLRPTDPARGSGHLLSSVVNRGRTALLPFSHPPPGFVPTYTDRIEPGDAFLLRHSWTVALCGWQWDVIRRPGALGLVAPLALDANGGPAETDVTVQFQPLTYVASQHLGHWPTHPPFNAERLHQPYPAADLLDPAAAMTVCDLPGGPKTMVPRESWRFARADGVAETSDAEWVTLDGGFEAGRIYELVYRTNRCPVVGAGLLAIRDAASFLRYGTSAEGNPCAGELSHAFAHGVSQTGRFLREFLRCGLNLDESGRQVFDAIYPQVAGARRGEFNFRGAQPSAQYVIGPAQRPPFAAVPSGGVAEGLYDLQRRRRGMPKIFEVNTANEYWRSHGALVHADLDANRDLALPADMRAYLFAGCQHGAGPPALMDRSPLTPEQRLANPINMLNYTPLNRAVLSNLERWAADGVAPPDSKVPTIAREELVPREALVERFRRIPGANVPDHLPELERFDGVGHYPYAVSNVDDDLNEIAGIRMPELAVPLATYAGWNPRHAETGGAGQVADMMGGTFPFPATEAGRARSGDPRKSIEERYRDRYDYCARVRAEAERLVRARLLLDEDVDRIVRGAGRTYDLFNAPVTARV